jgi:hypothetical protein
MGGACGTHNDGQMRTKYCLESLKERERSENLAVNGKTILQWILRQLDRGVCTLAHGNSTQP